MNLWMNLHQPLNLGVDQDASLYVAWEQFL